MSKIKEAAALEPQIRAEVRRALKAADAAQAVLREARGRLRVCLSAKREVDRQQSAAAERVVRRGELAALLTSDAPAKTMLTPAPDAPDDTTEEAPPPEETPS